MKGDRNLKLQRKLLGILLTICLLAGVMGGMAETAFAADPATLTVSSGSCEVGGTVKVTVKVSAPDTIAIVQFVLTYDTSLLECEGHDGSITELDDSISEKSKTYTYTFKGKKEGTATIKASKVEILPLRGGDAFPGGTKVSNGTVTVKPPYVASTNAYLKSLSVEEGKISPSFSKDTYEYSMELDGKKRSVSVSAKAEDSKAKVSVSGNKDLKEGKNTVSITVTAEDGKTKKTYKITVNRGPAPTNTPTPTPSPSATPTPGLTVHVDEQDLTLLDEITAQLPEGFAAAETDVNGYHVAMASSDQEDTKLVQLSDGKLYVFSAGEDGAVKCYPLQTVAGSARLYRYLPKPENVEVPDGFAENEADIFGERLIVYRTEAEPDLVLAYLRSPEGTEGWYLVDVKEQTVQRYSDALYTVVQPTETVTPTPELSAEPSPEPTGEAGQQGANDPETPTPPETPDKNGDVNPAPARTTSPGGFWKLIESLSKRERIGAGIIAGLFGLCILLLVLLLIAHNRNAKEYDAEEEPEEDDSDETFDPRLLREDSAKHKAKVAEAMTAMKSAEQAERKAKKSVDEAKRAMDELEAGRKKPKTASKAAAGEAAKTSAKSGKPVKPVEDKPKAKVREKAPKPDDYDEEDYL